MTGLCLCTWRLKWALRLDYTASLDFPSSISKSWLIDKCCLSRHQSRPYVFFVLKSYLISFKWNLLVTALTLALGNGSPRDCSITPGLCGLWTILVAPSSSVHRQHIFCPSLASLFAFEEVSGCCFGNNEKQVRFQQTFALYFSRRTNCMTWNWLVIVPILDLHLHNISNYLMSSLNFVVSLPLSYQNLEFATTLCSIITPEWYGMELLATILAASVCSICY